MENPPDTSRAVTALSNSAPLPHGIMLSLRSILVILSIIYPIPLSLPTVPLEGIVPPRFFGMTIDGCTSSTITVPLCSVAFFKFSFSAFNLSLWLSISDCHASYFLHAPLSRFSIPFGLLGCVPFISSIAFVWNLICLSALEI